jgi:hypothetical protein
MHSGLEEGANHSGFEEGADHTVFEEGADHTVFEEGADHLLGVGSTPKQLSYIFMLSDAHSLHPPLTT